MYRLIVSAVVALALIFHIGVAAAQSAYTEPNTRVEFPYKIGNLEFYGLKEYEDPRLGASLRYQKPGVWLDVFIYDLGLTDIPNGAVSDEIVQVFGQAKDDIIKVSEMGYYQDLDLIDEKIAQIRPGLKARYACFEYFQVGEEGRSTPGVRRSYLYMFGYKNQFFKLRYSYLKREIPDGEKQVSDFLRNFGKLFK